MDLRPVVLFYPVTAWDSATKCQFAFRKCGLENLFIPAKPARCSDLVLIFVRMGRQCTTRSGRNDCTAIARSTVTIEDRWVNGSIPRIRSIDIRIALDITIAHVRGGITGVDDLTTTDVLSFTITRSAIAGRVTVGGVHRRRLATTAAPTFETR